MANDVDMRIGLGMGRRVDVYNHRPTPTATAQTMAETNRTIDGALWLRQRWVNVLPMSPIIPDKAPTIMNHLGNICIISPPAVGSPIATLIIANVTVPIKEAAVASVHSTQTTVADSAARVSWPGNNSNGALLLLLTHDRFTVAARVLDKA
jgi:hypothetical protein